MKAITLFIIIILSLQVKAQKIDSVQQVQANRFVDSVKNNTPVQKLIDWSYRKMSAEKYDEFIQMINYFLQEKYNERNKK